MIKKSLDDFFDKNDVKKINALGMPFDPIKHHAVMTVESDDENKDHIVEVFQDGYMLADKVIRPSMVKVSH
jgi:molecular chaperone GrpE